MTGAPPADSPARARAAAPAPGAPARAALEPRLRRPARRLRDWSGCWGSRSGCGAPPREPGGERGAGVGARVRRALPAAGPLPPRARRGVPPPQDAAAFTALPTCERGDLNRDFVSFVPDGEPLDDLIVYETAGTTGHPVDDPLPPARLELLPAAAAGRARGRAA